MEHIFAIEPESYSGFADEAALIEQCKQWGLLSGKALKTKAFVYKRNGGSLPVTLVGCVDSMTAVIEFDNMQRHCIHPSLLKEMQASNYGQKLSAQADQPAGESEEAGETDDSADTDLPKEEAAPVEREAAPADEPDMRIETARVVALPVEEAPIEKLEAAGSKAKKEKASKPQLPEEKVKMTAVVKEFTTVPNHFSDTEDEVVIYEAVAIVEPAVSIGDAWSSNSATLKKFELEVGDTIAFEGKIIAKKLTKHPVPYKINNPGKIQKS